MELVITGVKPYLTRAFCDSTDTIAKLFCDRRSQESGNCVIGVLVRKIYDSLGESVGVKKSKKKSPPEKMKNRKIP